MIYYPSFTFPISGKFMFANMNIWEVKAVIEKFCIITIGLLLTTKLEQQDFL